MRKNDWKGKERFGWAYKVITAYCIGYNFGAADVWCGTHAAGAVMFDIGLLIDRCW